MKKAGESIEEAGRHTKRCGWLALPRAWPAAGWAGWAAGSWACTSAGSVPALTATAVHRPTSVTSPRLTSPRPTRSYYRGEAAEPEPLEKPRKSWWRLW